MARSLNKVILIGNLTRDPELRTIPSGASVCSFAIATNRNWTTDDGQKKEDTQFHNIVSWGKLAELCNQLLSKGRKVYIEGRIELRVWTSPEGVSKNKTEIILDDMILLDSQKNGTDI